jgi:PAS domain S-box-containing protein
MEASRPQLSKLGQRLEELNTEKGLGVQQALAECLNVHQSTASRLINGKIRKLSAKRIESLATFLKVSTSVVIAELADPFPQVRSIEDLIETNLKEHVFAIADDLPFHVYIKSPGRKFVWANKSMLSACNCSTLSELKGLGDEDLFENPHLEEASEDDEMVLRGKIIVDKLEFETWKTTVFPNVPGAGLRSPNRLRLVVTTKKPLVKSGIIYGMIGFTRDCSLQLPNIFGSDSLSSFDRGIYYQNLTKKKIWLDQAFMEYFPGDSVRQRWKSVGKDDKIRIACYLRYLVGPKKGPAFETRTATMDFAAKIHGEYKWIRATGIAYGDKEQRRFVCAHKEINESAVQESLASRILLSLPKNVFVFVEDQLHRCRYINKAFLDALGSPLHAVIGKRLELTRVTSSPHFKPADFKDDEVVLPVLNCQTIVTNAKTVISLVIIRIPLSVSSFDPALAFSANKHAPFAGRDKHYLGIAWSASAGEDLFSDSMQESEWAASLDSSADAIYVKSASGIYRFVNQAFAKVIGKTKEEIIGKSPIDLFSNDPELLETVLREDDALVNRGVKFIQATRQRTQKDGTIRYEASNKMAIADRSGSVRSILGINREISA